MLQGGRPPTRRRRTYVCRLISSAWTVRRSSSHPRSAFTARCALPHRASPYACPPRAPQTLLAELPIEPDRFLLFVQHNAPNYFADVAELVPVLADLSDADLLYGPWQVRGPPSAGRARCVAHFPRVLRRHSIGTC